MLHAAIIGVALQLTDCCYLLDYALLPDDLTRLLKRTIVQASMYRRVHYIHVHCQLVAVCLLLAMTECLKSLRCLT
jgi:hypothetical protein